MDENDTHDFLQQNIFNFQYLKQRAVKDTRGFSQHHWNLFRFVHIISAESNVTFLIPFIFFLVRILQSIASFSIGTMFTIEDLGENKTFLHKLIRIALPEPLSSYSGHIMTISLVSIFSFYFGLFYMKRKVIGKKFAFFLYIFTGELPEVYVTALASFIGYFLALLFKNELRILQIFRK